MATCMKTIFTMGDEKVDKQHMLIYVLMILLGISMYTNDNCEVKEASEMLLQPFFFDPRNQSDTWEK